MNLFSAWQQHPKSLSPKSFSLSSFFSFFFSLALSLYYRFYSFQIFLPESAFPGKLKGPI
jgi:hypothetical protein